MEQPLIKDHFQADTAVHRCFRQQLHDFSGVRLDQSGEYQYQRLQGRWHSGLVDLLDHAEQHGGVDVGLYLVEDLDDQVAEADSGCLVGQRGEELLGAVDDALGVANLQYLLVSVEDEVLEGCRAVEMQEHVV